MPGSSLHRNEATMHNLQGGMMIYAQRETESLIGRYTSWASFGSKIWNKQLITAYIRPNPLNIAPLLGTDTPYQSPITNPFCSNAGKTSVGGHAALSEHVYKSSRGQCHSQPKSLSLAIFSRVLDIFENSLVSNNCHNPFQPVS